MSRKAERAHQQNAAEFFTEHQQIAGFDNAGKSLFTTIRELVENSLDAAESIKTLPEITVQIEETTESEHNEMHGISLNEKQAAKNKKDEGDEEYGEGDDNGSDTEAAGTGAKRKLKASAGGSSSGGSSFSNSKKAKSRESLDSQMSLDDAPAAVAPAKGGKAGTKRAEAVTYYNISVKDNGCGIPADSVGNMLGKVLSGSKQGIRQTRGKFGLGAKMALIWSKKSSGLPITVRTAHLGPTGRPTAVITTIVLDMDIYKNTPRIVSREEESNTDAWHGVEISLTIAGKWSTYRQKVLQYFQQLAVITPCADLQFRFRCARDDSKSFDVRFDRRSTQMPPVPRETLPHPRGLNNVTLQNLLRETTKKSIKDFLQKDLRGVPPAVAGSLAKQLGIDDRRPNSLDSKDIFKLYQTLRDNNTIKPPTGDCLSPAGEYNMRLGVIKELHPTMIATHTEKAGAHEGHPFIVEAAVSLGGKTVREGINVYRFANRIPLLFEVGADVVTQVATKRINWSNYHIKQDSDRIGVFVSIVSTRIPFKGTSKEYIGDDVTEMQASVKKAIISCCQQLKVHISKKISMKDEQERKKTFLRYVPDVTNALARLVTRMKPAVYANHTIKDRAFSFTGSEDSVKRSLGDSLTRAVEKFEEGVLMSQQSAAAAIQNKKGGGGEGKEDGAANEDFFLQPRNYGLEGNRELVWYPIADGLSVCMPPSS
jgi:DNA topoisomerase VI B subunit